MNDKMMDGEELEVTKLTRVVKGDAAGLAEVMGMDEAQKQKLIELAKKVEDEKKAEDGVK